MHITLRAIFERDLSFTITRRIRAVRVKSSLEPDCEAADMALSARSRVLIPVLSGAVAAGMPDGLCAKARGNIPHARNVIVITSTLLSIMILQVVHESYRTCVTIHQITRTDTGTPSTQALP